MRHPINAATEHPLREEGSLLQGVAERGRGRTFTDLTAAAVLAGGLLSAVFSLL